MKKKLILFLSLTLLALGLVACGEEGEEPATSEDALMPRLRVGVLSIDDSLPIALAAEEGRYADAGLDVEIFPFKSSSDQSQALEAGELDIVMNDMIVQGLMKKGGSDTKIISYAFGATPQEGRFMVLGAPESGLTEATDLEGAKVAISTNTMMEFLMDSYAEHLHLDRDSMAYVNMPNLILRMESLLEGQDIQAAILPDPLASFAESQGASVLIDDTKLEANYSQSVYLARADFLEENPESVGLFLEIIFSMMEDINAHPDEYREFALNFAKVPESLQANYPMPTYSPGQVPDEEQVGRVMQWLYDKGLTDEVYSYQDMVSLDFVGNRE